MISKDKMIVSIKYIIHNELLFIIFVYINMINILTELFLFIIECIGLVFVLCRKFRVHLKWIENVIIKLNHVMVQQINKLDLKMRIRYVVLCPINEIHKMDCFPIDEFNAFTLSSMSFMGFLYLTVNVVLFLVLEQTMYSTVKQFTVCKPIKCEILVYTLRGLRGLRDKWVFRCVGQEKIEKIRGKYEIIVYIKCTVILSMSSFPLVWGLEKDICLNVMGMIVGFDGIDDIV